MLIAAMTLMLVGLLMTVTGNLVISIVAIAIFTSGFFGGHAIASGWVSRRATHARAAAASLYLFAYYVGSSLFGSAGGLFWSRFGWPGYHGAGGRSDLGGTRAGEPADGRRAPGSRSVAHWQFGKSRPLL